MADLFCEIIQTSTFGDVGDVFSEGSLHFWLVQTLVIGPKIVREHATKLIINGLF